MAQRTLPPSVVRAPVMRMSTRLSLAPLSSVTRLKMANFARTARSQMDPPNPATLPGFRTTAVRAGLLMGVTRDNARRPWSSDQSARTSSGRTPRASAAAALARLVRAWVLIRLCPTSPLPGTAASAVPVMTRSAGPLWHRGRPAGQAFLPLPGLLQRSGDIDVIDFHVDFNNLQSDECFNSRINSCAHLVGEGLEGCPV